MSAAAPLIFPGGRIVAGWWRQLAPFRPCNLWIAYLLVRRVEVLVRANTSSAIDPLLHSVLGLLANPRSVAALADLHDRLHLGTQLIRQALRILECQELVARQGGEAWSLTERGRLAHTRRALSSECYGRRSFFFLEGEPHGCAPRFVKLDERPRMPWAPAEDSEFDLSQLDACLRQSDAWKLQHGFPTDILGFVRPQVAAHEPAPGDPPEWQRTAVVHAERLPVALVRATNMGDQAEWLAFEFQQQGWHLHANAPAFTLGEDWRELLPQLAEPVSTPRWQAAWQSWLQSRGVPAPDATDYQLERSAARLHVRAAPALVERFRSAVRPTVQGDIWLLAGEGRFREALHVDVASG